MKYSIAINNPPKLPSVLNTKRRDLGAPWWNKGCQFCLSSCTLGCGRREPRYPSFISTAARGTAPWMLQEGCPARPCSPSCAFLSWCPVLTSSSSLAVTIPGKRKAPQGTRMCTWILLEKCESTSQISIYPTGEQRAANPESPILWDTPKLPWTAQCALPRACTHLFSTGSSGCALLKSVVVCLVS